MPAQIAQVIEEFKKRATQELRRESLMRRDFASSTRNDGRPGGIPPSPFQEGNSSESSGREAVLGAGRPSSGPAVDPPSEDPGGGITAPTGALDGPPPVAAAVIPSAVPIPGEAHGGAQLGGTVSNAAAAAAAAVDKSQTGTIPKVRDSGLGTSRVSESVLEISMRLMRENPSAQEWHDHMMQAVHRLEKAVCEKRVSDVRRQVKEIIPLRRGVEHGFLQNVQGWPVANQQAVLGQLTVAVEGVVALADTFLEEDLQLDDVKCTVLASIERMLRITTEFPKDATIHTMSLQRVSYFLDELRNECQEMQVFLAPIQASGLNVGVDRDLAILLRQTADRVGAAWKRAIALRAAHIEAMGPDPPRKVRNIPLPAMASRGPYQFAPENVTFLEHGPAVNMSDITNYSSDESGRQRMLAYITAFDDTILLKMANPPPGWVAPNSGHAPTAPAAPGGQGQSVQYRDPPVFPDGGAMRAVMPGLEDPFGGPPLASSRQG